MSLSDNINIIKSHLKDEEKDSINNIIKKESSKQMTQKYHQISFENNNNSSFLNTPLFSPSAEELNSYIPQMSQKQVLNVFKSQNSTKQLQKQLVGISKENIDKIINELSGVFSKVIKDKNGNYFCSSLINRCSQEQRI